MTVSATNAHSGPFVGNGATTAFPYTFKALSTGEVQVFVDGTEVVSGFTVMLGTLGNGGTVTFSTAPVTDAEIVIASDPAFSQDISFTNAGQFLASSHDTALDRSSIRDIALKGMVDRAIKLPVGETVADIGDAESRAGMLIGFDGDGELLVGPSTSFGGAQGPAGDPTTAGLTFATLETWGGLPDDPTAGATNDAAMQAALASLPDRGGIIWIPPKAFYFSSTVHVVKPVIFQGSGKGQNPGIVDGVTMVGPDIYNGSRLVFPQGIKWFHFHTHTLESSTAIVTADFPSHYDEFSAVGSSLRDLCILGAGTAAGATPPAYVANAEAVRTNVPITINDVWVINPSGDGVVVSASSVSIGFAADYGNANQCDFRKLKIYKAGRHATVFEGADANICTTYDLDASFCGGAAIWDKSFLGTTHFAPHMQKNNQSTLVTHLGVTLSQAYGSVIVEENSAVTTIYSPYIENPTTGEMMKLMSACTVFPGIGSANRYIDAGSTGTVHNIGGLISGYYGGWNRLNAVSTRFFYGTGPNATPLVAFGFGNTNESATAGDWKMKYELTAALWRLELGNAGTGASPIQFGNSPAYGASARVNLIMPNGLRFRANGAGAEITSAAAKPSTGTYRIGDYVENEAPAVAGAAASQYVIKGWKRLTTGSAHVLNTDWVECRTLTGT